MARSDGPAFTAETRVTAAAGGLPPASKMKRKTPSELRGEQLRRRTAEKVAENLLPPMASDRMRTSNENFVPAKIPRYINTRVSDIYPVKKSLERCQMTSGKEALKVGSSSLKDSLDSGRSDDPTSALLNCRMSSNAECSSLPSTNNQKPADLTSKVITDNSVRKENCSQNALRNVVELHLGNEKLADSANIDMEKALKRLAARDDPTPSLATDSTRNVGDLPSTSPRSRPTEIRLPGRKVPLDLTLKSTLQLVTSSSVKWCHKTTTSFLATSFGHFTSISSKECQDFKYTSDTDFRDEMAFSKALQSWVYPQSTLPSTIISLMASSNTNAERDFLARRHRDWEDSFRSLYYMLRKNLLNLFYVCSAHFVVLFVGGNLGGRKRSCYAYLSQSTRGLRTLLRKQGISFSMPLCSVEGEQASEDDLTELSEIERQSLGQTLRLDSLSDVDNTPQSLLSFVGRGEVHGLYDFLLNCRHFFSSLAGADVPLLYSPVPFQNACLHVPEVQSKEVRKADAIASTIRSDSEGIAGPSMCYSVEIKDTFLPPWVVSRVCSVMCSDKGSFDAMLETEPLSIALNVALDMACSQSDPTKTTTTAPSSESSGVALGMPEAVVVPSLHGASLRRLRYADGAYVAYACA